MTLYGLGLDTELTIDTRIGLPKKIKLREILTELKSRFPDGFYSRVASSHLVDAFGGVPKEFDVGRVNSTAFMFYKALTQAGFLKATKEEPKSRKGLPRYHYTVDEDILTGRKKPEYATLAMRHPIQFPEISANIVLPEGLTKLISTYADLAGTHRGGMIKEALEQRILADESFLGTMKIIRQRHPAAYASMGGAYLDNLLQASIKR